MLANGWPRSTGCQRWLVLWTRCPVDRTAGAPSLVRAGSQVRDPEFRKNLRIVCNLVDEADRLAHRGRLTDAQATRLQQAVTLPEVSLLRLRTLLECRSALELELIRVGDDAYIPGRAADLFDEGPGTLVTWRSLFNDVPPATLADVLGEVDTSGDSWSVRVERTARGSRSSSGPSALRTTRFVPVVS